MIARFLEVVAVSIAVATVAVGSCVAQTAADWTLGPTLPFYVDRFNGERGFFAAGAGVSFKRNFAPNDDGSVRWFTVGVPVFFQVRDQDPTDSALAAGLTLGTYNDMLSLGVGADLTASGDRGLLRGNGGRDDVFLMVAFGLNLGSGAEPQGAVRRAQESGGDKARPPCYVGF